MRKLLIATTALTLAGSAAFAELSMSGSAELGIEYDSEKTVKHTFVHQADIDFAGSGTTDGGLSFGGAVGFNTGADTIDTGTVHISGSFGTLTIGDNDAADILAGGVADVGMNAIGVDDAGEALRGSTAAQLRYDQSFGAATLAVTAGNRGVKKDAAGVEVAADSPYAVGLSFAAGDIRIGVGYDSTEAVSLGAGYTVANISVNGFFSSQSKWKDILDSSIVDVSDEDLTAAKADLKGYAPKASTIGADLTYTLGATALTVAYSKVDVKAGQAGEIEKGKFEPANDVSGTNVSSVGVGITHDLGGGAAVTAGFGKVEKITDSETTLAADRPDKGGEDKLDLISAVVTSYNKASVGITLKF